MNSQFALTTLLSFCLAGIGLTAMTPQAQASSCLKVAQPGYASERDALIGQWERQDGSFTIVYLPDGRTASRLNQRSVSAASVRLEPGTYRIEGDRIKYEWMMTEPQEEQFRLEGDTLTTGDFKLPFRASLYRTGGVDKATATYAAICKELREVAERSFQEVAVGPVKPQPLHPVGVIPDTRFAEVVSGATVYSQETRFQWVLTPVHLYKTHSLNEPGMTCCSYTFLPNGRFYFDGWLYGVLIDDKMPFNENNPSEVLKRQVPVKHQQWWGKYRVVPGRDALDGDTVEIVDNGGFRQTLKVVDGRRYLITSKPRMLFNNWQQVKKYPQ